MNREQYAQLLASRRRAGARRLDESGPMRKAREAPRPTAIGRVVATAVRALRRRALAIAAWERLAPPALADCCRVVAVRRQLIEIEVAGPSARFEFERQRARLERSLCQAVPGTRRVVLTVAGASGAGGAEESA